MSGPDRPIRPGNRTEAGRWLAIVEEDIDVAIATLVPQVSPPLLDPQPHPV